MCLLAVLFRVIDGVPVVIGANREEEYARGGSEPALRLGPIPFVAGLDPIAGGTWLGVNARGVVVTVTNRHRRGVPPTARSRGMLVKDLLACASAKEACELATRELDTRQYGGCNLVCVDESAAYVIQAGDWLRVLPLPPGEHVLTNGDVNQATDPRTAFALERLRARQFDSATDAISELRRLCAHTRPPVPICLHGETAGTVSSTVFSVPTRRRDAICYHAQGPPDRVPYHDRSELLHRLFRNHQER